MEFLNLQRFISKVSILFSTVLVVSCSTDSFEPEPVEELNLNSSIANSTANAKVVKDQYIVLLSKKPAKGDPKAEAALEALTKEVGNMNGAKVKGTFRFALTGFTAKLNERQLGKIKKDPRVISVTPDQYIELEAEDINTVTVQPYPLWGLDRIDQRETVMDRAYSYTATGSGVNVYVVDSGIRYSHEEFGGRASLGVDLVKADPDEQYDDDDPNLELGNDCNGHGTHVAGTIGGKTYGVAKNVNLISIRVFSCVGITSESRVIQAVEWLTANAKLPAVVNMSLGGGAYEPLDLAIENSIQTAGINYITSAGNSNDNACNYTPARTPGAITVGATDISNNKASFSNFGDCLDVYAPGYNIMSASHQDDTSAVAKNGTSMAAPHVAGVAALYLENNPGVTPGQLQNEVILNSTPDVVKNVPSGSNRIVYSLWEPVAFTAPTPPDLNLRVIGIDQKGSNQYYLVWDPTNDPVVDIYKDGSYFGRARNTGEFSTTLNGKGNITFRVCEVNYNNCSADVMADFGPTDFVPNQPPTAAFSYEVNDLQVSFIDESFDSDGSIIRRNLYFGDGYYTTRESPTYTYREPGVYEVELYIEDDHGNSDYEVKQITVGTIVPSPETLELSAVGSKRRGEWVADLSWTPAGGTTQIDIYRNESFLRRVDNTGSYTDRTSFNGGGSLEYKICETGTSNCSNTVTLQY